MNHRHQHGHTPQGDRRRLAIALAVTIGGALLGAIGAALTGSLALLADLGHLLTDAGALLAALIASILAARPATARRTYGLGRVEVLVAGVNALTLILVAAWVGYEGVHRLFSPAEIPGLPMLVIGALGLAANITSLLVLAGGDRQNMNMRGAALHVLGDALGSVGVLAAAVVLLTTGWPYADTVASLFIIALIVPRTLALLREVGHVLLEGAPRDIDVELVRAELHEISGVSEVHDLHVWAINDRKPAVSAHLVIEPTGDGSCDESSVLDSATRVLRERFELTHSTVQIEHREYADHAQRCT